MSLVLQSSGGGSVTLQEPVTADNTTLTVPSGNGSFVTANAAGNVGIGFTNPNDSKLSVAGNFRWGDSEQGRLTWSPPNIIIDSTATAGATIFRNNPLGTGSVERMRIDNTGRLLVGITTGGSGTSGIVGAVGYCAKAGVGAGLNANTFNINWTGSPQLWIDTTNIGTFAFTSDYRIKRNIKTQTAPALERVMALRPVTYQMADYKDGLFKASEDIKEGFIAHEVQEVIPSGAEGVKDDENQIQSLRPDAILAVAVKAIQELKSELDAVKAELNELKGAA